MKTNFCTIVLSLTLGFSCSFAAEPNSHTVTLSLAQLIERAIAGNPEIGAIESEVAASRSDLEQVNWAYFPQVETTALIGPVQDAKRPVVQGTRIVDPSPDTIGAFGRIDFTATQPLYTFGKLSNRKEAALRGVKATEQGVLQKKGEIALRVRQLYYGLVLARSGLSAADEAEQFFRDARNRIDRLLELGSINVMESDLYRIDAYRADTVRSRAEAEKGAQTAYYALKAMIRLPEGQEFAPSESMLSAKGEALDHMDNYVRRAIEQRPEFKQLDEALAAQQFQVDAARSDRYPSFFLALIGSFAGAPGREKFDNRYISDTFNHTDLGVVAGLRWNFDFGISNAKIAKEAAVYDKLRQTREAGRLNIPIQVAQHYQEIGEQKTAVAAYRQAASAARKWIVTALANFDMGVGTADDMLRAIEKYGENQGKYIESLYRYNLSIAELEYASGEKTW
jgi:outer membrane protein